MPTNRRRRRPAYIGLTEDMIEAWIAGDRARLNTLCAITPWQWSPFDRLPAEPPPPQGDAATLAALPNAHSGWHRAVDLREALLAYGPAGRSDRHGRPARRTLATGR